MEEWAALPILRCLALIGAPVIHRLDRIRQIRAPAEDATLVYRVKRVENDHGAGQRNARIGDPRAKTGHQLAVGSADQPGLCHPAGEFVESRLIHVTCSVSTMIV